MSSNYDGTSGIKGDQVTGDKLDRTRMWHGTTLPTNPTNEVPSNGLFLKTDTGAFYENTGTIGSPVFEILALPDFLLGDGSDGDVTISGNRDLGSSN